LDKQNAPYKNHLSLTSVGKSLTPKDIRTSIHIYNIMNTVIIAFLFLLLIGAGTGVGVVVAQNITANESANMNSSTLQLSGNLTNTSSTIISNTT